MPVAAMSMPVQGTVFMAREKGSLVLGQNSWQCLSLTLKLPTKGPEAKHVQYLTT